jgi:hypothetical protein
MSKSAGEGLRPPFAANRFAQSPSHSRSSGIMYADDDSAILGPIRWDLQCVFMNEKGIWSAASKVESYLQAQCIYRIRRLGICIGNVFLVHVASAG